MQGGRRRVRIPVRPPEFLGRRSECEALDRLLADALAGQSRVTVLRGEAGNADEIAALARDVIDRGEPADEVMADHGGAGRQAQR